LIEQISDGTKILMVDDDEDILFMYKLILLDANFIVDSSKGLRKL